MKELLQKVSEPVNVPLFDNRDEACRTFVVTVRYEVMNAPAVLLKFYSTDGTEVQCSLVQAARATTAAPTFFEPAAIGLNKYVDGGVRFNNPAEQAILEASRIWGSRPIGCLVSLGTGKGLPISGASRRGILGIFAPYRAEQLTVAKYCTELATSCEPVHHRLVEGNRLPKGRFKDRYYRFNVENGATEIGLNEWEKLSVLSERTEAYLDEPSEKPRLENCAKLLMSEEDLIKNIG